MSKICTSFEQSKKLLELGIDVNTADMHYSTWTILNGGEYILSPNQGETIEELQEDYGNQVIPAWSLSALLDLLPKGEDTIIDLCFGGYKGEEYIDEWFYTFEDNKEPFEFHSCINKDKLDAVFEMFCWLKENGKI